MAPRTTRTDPALCMLCEAICGLEVEHDGREVLQVRGDAADPFSRGHICPKGVALADIQNDPDRLRRPLRRIGDRFEEVSWDDALAEAASRLVDVQRRHGRDAVALYVGNPTGHSYTAYLLVQMLKEALGTKNHFSAGSVDANPRLLASLWMYGNQAVLPIPDLDRTRHMLILGANPLVSNGSVMTAPDVARRLRDLRSRGGRLVVVDPRRSETAAMADEHHFIRPGTDALLLAALVRVLLDEGRTDLAAAAPFADGFERLPALLAPFTPERVAPVVGIDAATLTRLAREFAEADGAVCYGRMGTCVQEFGTLASWLVDVLNTVSGNLDRVGGAMFPRPAVDLVRLAQLIGLKGSHGSFRSRVSDLPEFAGELPVAAFAEEMETPGPGQIRALVTHAGNPVLSLPNGARLARAFDGLEFMLAIDIYRNETTRHADLILPPTFGLEHDQYPILGHAVAVRNTAHFAPALLEPAAGARHDDEILLDLVQRVARERGGLEALGRGALVRLARAIGPRGLLRLLLRTGRPGVTLKQLLAAPHGIDLGAHEPRLAEVLGKGGRIDLAPEPLRNDLPRLERRLTAAAPAPANELRLVSRRSLRSNNSWMHNSPRLVSGKDRCVLLMHPDDAHARALRDGQRVELKSQVGQIEAPLAVSDEMMPGVVCLPHGWGHALPGNGLRVAAAHPGVSVNDVIDDRAIDALSATSILSGVPVRVSAVEPPAAV